MKEISIDQMEQALNHYMCVTLHGEKDIAKVIKVEKDKGLVYYMLYGGKNAGKTYKSEYATYMTTKIFVYTEEEAIVALLAH